MRGQMKNLFIFALPSIFFSIHLSYQREGKDHAIIRCQCYNSRVKQGWQNGEPTYKSQRRRKTFKSIRLAEKRYPCGYPATLSGIYVWSDCQMNDTMLSIFFHYGSQHIGFQSSLFSSLSSLLKDSSSPSVLFNQPCIVYLTN